MIKIIDYGMGNAGSIGNMLLKLGEQFSIVTRPEEDLSLASLIILPGVGSFDNGMSKLRERGFDQAIKHAVSNDAVLFLGICLGMQLLFESSEEGVLEGLNLIPGRAVKFKSVSTEFKVPHMGWNRVHQINQASFLDGAFDDARFYFAHSYHVSCANERVVCKTNYGYDFPSVVARGNIYGVQFHPEKSHRFGLGLLKRFVGQVNEK